MDRKAFLSAAGAGAAAQVLMVATGHFVSFIADNLFALGGVAIALAAGVLYVRLAQIGTRLLAGGMLAGGFCAIIGIAVSAALGDVPWLLLLFGGLSGLVGGAVGAALGKGLFRTAAADESPGG